MLAFGATKISMSNQDARKEIRKQLQTALAACEDKKAVETRILELDPVDSGLTDYFLITSATNERQAIAIADEIEFKLKREYSMYPNSVEGRRQGEWILLDYVDFVVHVFQTEKRAFYDIERLRKSARPLTPEEFDAELKADLSEKTRAVRTKAKPAATAAKTKPAATKAKPVVAKKKAAEIAKKNVKNPQKTAKAKKVVAKKAVVKKAAKKAPAKKLAVKKAAKKIVNKVAKKAPVKKAAKKVIKKPMKKILAKKPVTKAAKKRR
jgi:ribosome-associated protein